MWKCFESGRINPLTAAVADHVHPFVHLVKRPGDILQRAAQTQGDREVAGLFEHLRCIVGHVGAIARPFPLVHRCIRRMQFSLQPRLLSLEPLSVAFHPSFVEQWLPPLQNQ